MRYGYQVYTYTDGVRDNLAAFKYGDDAFVFASAASGGRFLMEKNVVSVRGWDGRVWWQFKQGKLTDFNQPKKVKV